MSILIHNGRKALAKPARSGEKVYHRYLFVTLYQFLFSGMVFALSNLTDRKSRQAACIQDSQSLVNSQS
jgi:hypothetical protein